MALRLARREVGRTPDIERSDSLDADVRRRVGVEPVVERVLVGAVAVDREVGEREVLVTTSRCGD